MATRALARRSTRTVYIRATSRRRRKQFTVPLAVIGGLAPPVLGVWSRRNDLNEMSGFLRAGFTGVGNDGNFNFLNFKYGLIPVATGFLVHAVASKIGLNRALSRAGIPFLRV